MNEPRKPGRPKKYDYDIHVKSNDVVESAIESAMGKIGDVRSEVIRKLIIKGAERLENA